MEDLLKAMAACEQSPGLSVLQHGEMVRDYYRDLTNGRSIYEWRLPDWIDDVRVPERYDLGTLGRYQLFHDVGKPVCRTNEGRFPDHAAVSKRVWLEHGGDQEVADLIGMDMDIHTLKDVGVAEFAARPQAIPLLLTGLAEIHANASMFGGLDSTSFKMKWKQINKRGKAILR